MLLKKRRFNLFPQMLLNVTSSYLGATRLDCQDISFLAMPMGTDDPFALFSLESHLDGTILGEGMS